MLNRLKGILYEITGLFAASGNRKKQSSAILIVKTDEIGDYLLWRCFLKELSTSERFSGKTVHFCGNSSWKSLFDAFDSDGIQHTIWLEKLCFKKDLFYRFRFLKNIYRERYLIVINPTYSRDKRNDDAIVKAAMAGETIGMVGNPESVKPYELGYDKGLYTQLFDHSEKPLFEFLRNRLFTEFITGTQSQIKNTLVPFNRLPVLPIELPEKFAVVFPGSRSKSRIWPTDYFIAVCNYLYTSYGFTIVIAGAGADKIYTTAFADQYQYPCINLYGSTTLPQMLSLLKNAQCLLSVDTGSVHLAAAAGCAVFGVFNGSQYKRFAPYPPEIAPDFFAIYPDEVEAELSDAELVKKKYEFVVPVPYSSVSPEKMIQKIAAYFNR